MLPAFTPPLIPRQNFALISDTDTSFDGIDVGDSVTFAGMAAGNARADRLLIAAIHFRDGATDVGFDIGVTIGGVTADLIVESGVGGGGTSYVSIWAALVPTGTTVNVAVTMTGFSGTVDQWGCTLVRATGLTSTTRLAIATDNVAASGDGTLFIDTTGAKFVVVISGDLSGDLSSRTGTSGSSGSTIALGHRMTRGLAFIDTTPPGGSVQYDLNSHGTGDPDLTAAACWG